MRLTVLLLASALFLSGCGDVHTMGQDITTPSPVIPPGVQTRLVLTASSRPDQQMDVTAQVLDGRGDGVPNVEVTFAITGGTVTPPIVTTDATGFAKAIGLASGQATLSATTSALTQKVTVIGGAVALSVNLFIGSATVGTASTFSASVTGTPIGGPFKYTWTYGDAQSEDSATNAITHKYNLSGTYSARVSVTDGSGRTATGVNTAVVSDPPAPPAPAPPAPAPTLSATVTCPTPSSHTASCNVALTFGGAAVSSFDVVNVDWDWGDGVPDHTNATPIKSHLYAQAGTYLVVATTTATASKYGTASATANKSIVVP